jgi:pyrimidine deaminase RibD-like protein
MYLTLEPCSLRGTNASNLLTSLQKHSNGIPVVFVGRLGNQLNRIANGTKLLGGDAARAVIIGVRDAFNLAEIDTLR